MAQATMRIDEASLGDSPGAPGGAPSGGGSSAHISASVATTSGFPGSLQLNSPAALLSALAQLKAAPGFTEHSNATYVYGLCA